MNVTFLCICVSGQLLNEEEEYIISNLKMGNYGMRKRTIWRTIRKRGNIEHMWDWEDNMLKWKKKPK